MRARRIRDRNPDVCAWPRCKRASTLMYLGVPLCDTDWSRLAVDDTDKINKARAMLRLPPRKQRT